MEDNHPAYLYNVRLDPAEIKADLMQKDPEYYQQYTDRDWESLAYTMTAIARLVWRISLRQVEESEEVAVRRDLTDGQ